MYLVTGAAGHFGQAVIASLIADHQIPASKIIATTRKAEAHAAFAAHACGQHGPQEHFQHSLIHHRLRLLSNRFTKLMFTR